MATPGRPFFNRRRYPRRSVDLLTEAVSGSSFFAGFCQNLSEDGLFIATHDLPPIGEAIFLSFQLPGGHQIQASGIVRWHRPCGLDDDDCPGIGVQFLTMNHADRIAIRMFFKQCEPLQYAS